MKRLNLKKQIILLIPVITLFGILSSEPTENARSDSLKSSLSQQIIHSSGHILLPISLAYIGYPSTWEHASLVLLGTNLVDGDHLLAKPIFDSDRCSIGTHPLHSIPAIGIYSGMLFHQKTQKIGVGLLTHMAVDYIDCINTKERLGSLKYPKFYSDPVNQYSLGHILCWYGLSQIPEIDENKMLLLSVGWELVELNLPFEFAQESYLNKFCDIIFNALGYSLGKTANK